MEWNRTSLNPAGSLRSRFDRLIHDLIAGRMTRSSYESWEIELLLDFETCAIPARRRAPILRRYQKNVQQQFRAGALKPMLLSEYLSHYGRRRHPKPKPEETGGSE
jgi:hypothetical protein